MQQVVLASHIDSLTELSEASRFLKYSPLGQFNSLMETQIDVLKYYLEESYLQDQPNQRSKHLVQQILCKRQDKIQKEKNNERQIIEDELSKIQQIKVQLKTSKAKFWNKYLPILILIIFTNFFSDKQIRIKPISVDGQVQTLQTQRYFLSTNTLISLIITAVILVLVFAFSYIDIQIFGTKFQGIFPKQLAGLEERQDELKRERTRLKGKI